jgi:hypothetical protein
MERMLRTIKPWWRASRKRRKPSSRRRSESVTAGDEDPKMESKDRGAGFKLRPGPSWTETHVLSIAVAPKAGFEIILSSCSAESRKSAISSIMEMRMSIGNA